MQLESAAQAFTKWTPAFGLVIFRLKKGGYLAPLVTTSQPEKPILVKNSPFGRNIYPLLVSY
jgi:hypothetical protein